MIRVLMVSKACLVGAYQTKLEAIAKYEDIELFVIVPPVWRDPAGEVRLERSHTGGYQLFVDPINFNGQFHFHYYPKLGQRMKEIRPDIVHMDEEPYNLATWLGVRQAQKNKAKCLFFSWQNIHKKYSFPFGLLERQVLENVDFAIMGNEASVEVWRSKGYTGPYQVIPQFGVDPELFKPLGLKDPGRGFVIGSAGRRLVPEKGIDLLLKASAKLSGIWRLHIAGDGPERSALAHLAQDLGIADRVFFDGVIGSEEMPSYLGQLDVLVLPSRTRSNWMEQFGRVLIEAMACEVPVIGSNSGEIPHVVGEDGLVFAEENSEALYQNLLKLQTNDSLREKLGKAGRERVLSCYTQGQVAARTVTVYRKIMANNDGEQGSN